jgi:hypothetical protein
MITPALATCSFAAYQPRMGTGVRIALGVPRQLPPGRWHWPFVAELAPRPWYFRAAAEKFDRHYLAQLDRLADDIETKLGWLAERYGPLVLCCFRVQGQRGRRLPQTALGRVAHRTHRTAGA